MSLINDALKRARETQRNSPPPGAPPLQPVESPARGSTGWILAASAVLFLAAAGFVLGPAWFGHKAPPPLAAKSPGVSAPSAAEAAPASMAGAKPVVPIRNPPPVAATTNPPPPAVAAVTWPKVQGIIFNATQPLAIVNGQTVNAGDRVGDFQVKQISQHSVVFQRPDGTQKTLGIGD